MTSNFLKINHNNSLPEEKIILQRRPHPIIPAFWISLVLFWLVYFNIALNASTKVRCIFFLASIILFFLASILIILDWAYNVLYVTDKRVVHRQGFAWKSFKAIPLRKIQNVSYRFGIVGRFAGFGTVTIESAARQYGSIIFYGIPSPAEVARIIQEQIPNSKKNNHP